MKKVRILKGRKYQEKTNVYVDMDGVIADFNNEPNALERFTTEKGFFKSLKVMNKWAFEMLMNNKEINLFVLSASPNEQADKDKLVWIKKYLNQINDKNICFCRLNENKAKVIKDKLNITIDNKCLLLDDYTKNLIEWQNLNGIGIKRITSKADNSTKKWKGLTLKDLKELTNIITI